jgi:hypothetical protein
MNCRCGQLLPPYVGVGRPRVRCTDCAANKSALGKAWRAANRAHVKAVNARRRAAYTAKRAA